MVHLKVGDFSCRTIGFISLIHPTVLPTAEKRRYEILRKTRLERFAGIGDRAGLPNKIRMLYKVPTPAPNLIYGLSSFEFFPFPPVASGRVLFRYFVLNRSARIRNSSRQKILKTKMPAATCFF